MFRVPARWRSQALSPAPIPLIATPLLIAQLLGLGLVTGFLAGLLGIGGGFMLVPVMTWLLVQQHAAPEHIVHVSIASALATICFTAISSVLAHHRRGNVLWPVALRLAPGILIGSYAGAWITSLLPGRVVLVMFACFMFLSSSQMWRNRKPKPSRTLPGTAGMLGAGGGVGLLAGMTGTGGAFVSIPFMVWCNVPPHRAVGTSASFGFPIALAGTLSYALHGWAVNTGLPWSLGYVYLPGVLFISLASVVGAPLGARVAARSSTDQLKRVFAIFLFSIGVWMALRGFGILG